MLTFTLMGIDTHLEKSIEEGKLDMGQLWLANYLKAQPAGDNVAEVTAFFPNCPVHRKHQPAIHRQKYAPVSAGIR